MSNEISKSLKLARAWAIDNCDKCIDDLKKSILKSTDTKLINDTNRIIEQYKQDKIDFANGVYDTSSGMQQMIKIINSRSSYTYD